MKLPLIALAALLTGAHAAPVLKNSAVAPRKGNWQNQDNEALYRLNYPDYREDKVNVPQAEEVGQYSNDIAQFVEALREYYYKQAVKKSKNTTPRKKRIAKIAPTTSPDKKTLLKAILGKENTRKGIPLRKKLAEKAAPKKPTKKPAPRQKKTLKEMIAKKPASVQKQAPEEVPAKEPATVKKPAPAQKETPEKKTTEKSNPTQNDSTEKDTSAKKDSAPAEKDTSKEDSPDKKDPAP